MVDSANPIIVTSEVEKRSGSIATTSSAASAQIM